MYRTCYSLERCDRLGKLRTNFPDRFLSRLPRAKIYYHRLKRRMGKLFQLYDSSTSPNFTTRDFRFRAKSILLAWYFNYPFSLFPLKMKDPLSFPSSPRRRRCCNRCTTLGLCSILDQREVAVPLHPRKRSRKKVEGGWSSPWRESAIFLFQASQPKSVDQISLSSWGPNVGIANGVINKSSFNIFIL